MAKRKSKKAEPAFNAAAYDAMSRQARSTYTYQSILTQLEEEVGKIAAEGGPKVADAARAIEGLHRLTQARSRWILGEPVDVDGLIEHALRVGAQAQRLGLGPMIDRLAKQLKAHDARYGGSRKEKRKRAEELFKQSHDFNKVAKAMGVTRRTLNRWFEKK